MHQLGTNCAHSEHTLHFFSSFGKTHVPRSECLHAVRASADAQTCNSFEYESVGNCVTNPANPVEGESVGKSVTTSADGSMVDRMVCGQSHP